MEGEKKGNITATVIVIVIIVAVLAYGAYKYMNKDSTVVVTPVETPVTPVEPTPVTTPPVDVPTSYLYKDGSYSATGSYVSPGGSQKISVSLTLKNDVVTTASAVSGATDPESNRYESIFIDNFKQYVVGKNIDSLKLTKVSGSSLTPRGFNDAVAQIKTQAKA